VEAPNVKRAVLAVLLTAAIGVTAEAASEVYGNFETLGVVAECPAGKSPGDIGRVRVYLLEGDAKRPVQDALQVGSERYYASSIFFLKPGTLYKVLVEFHDKAGGKLHEETLTGSTRPELRIPAPARSIFVSPGGSDGAAGSADAPMKTLGAALAKARAGTAIVLREGIYYEGDFSVAAAGTPQAPVVIMGAPGKKAILDASDPNLLESGWSEAGEGLFSHAYSGTSNLLALEEKATGKLIRAVPMPSLGDLTARRSAGKNFDKMGIDAAYFCGGGKVTVLTPKPDIKLYKVHVPARTRAFNIEGKRSLVIDNLGMRFYGKGAYSCAVFVQNSSDVVVQRCRMECNNTGVWLKGNCLRTTVQDNEFLDDLTRWHFGYIKSQGVNYHSQIESGCVYNDGRYAGRGLVVRHNRVRGLFDGAHMASDSNASKAAGQRYRTHETDFYRNDILGVADDFIEVDGYARNVRIFDNKMTNCLSGISIAQALDGPTWVAYNTICGFGVSSACTLESYEGYPVKSNGGLNTNIGSGYVVFYHNTSWTPHKSDSAFLVKSARWKKLIFRNNVWCGQSGGFNSWRASLSPIDMQNDVIYSPGGYGVKIGRATSGPGDKGNGVVLNFLKVDPQLKNPAARDYDIPPGSPCVDKGLVIAGINDGRTKGAGPDIGWHEAGLTRPAVGPRTKRTAGAKASGTGATAREPGPAARPGLAASVEGFVKLLRDGKGREAAAAIERFKTLADLTPEADAAYGLLAEACTAPERLGPAVVKAVEAGKRLRVYVMIAGRRMRGRVASADEKGIKAVVRGGEMPMPWPKVPTDELARLARQIAPGADEKTTRDIVLFLAAAGDGERAREVQARSRDAALGKDLDRLTKLLPPSRR